MDKNNIAYPRYGGRGIDFCEKWMDFRVFLADMGSCPEGYTLDRIDNNSGYNKANCRWASPTEQARNRRSNVLITIGDESRTAPEWAEISGVPDYAIRQRYDRGWPAEQAVFDPVMDHGQWLGGRGVVKYKIGDRNLTAGEWSKISGVPEKRITTRIHRDKWDPERAIFSPASKGRRAAEKWQDGPLSRDDIESGTTK